MTGLCQSLEDNISTQSLDPPTHAHTAALTGRQLQCACHEAVGFIVLLRTVDALIHVVKGHGKHMALAPQVGKGEGGKREGRGRGREGEGEERGRGEEEGERTKG